MASELQQRKFAKLFERFDADGDGQIQQSDINALVDGWARAYGVTPGSADWRLLANLANRLWQDLQGHLDTDGSKTVSREEWLATHANFDFVEKVAVPFALAAFDLGDTDNDGRVSLKEWLIAQETSGLTQGEAASVFQRLDTDSDGYITKAEYTNAMIEFYQSDQESAAGNQLAGRI
jgi:Ca2+-binding EF-hand superfamily protein